ncbi:MAG: alpha-amylase family glycosyl hydrolase [Candidatus Acidiferrales bacterium]
MSGLIIRRTRDLRVCGILFLLAAIALFPRPARSEAQARAATEGTPKVTKVDPPNWWAGFTSPVMVLVAGDSLEDARVTCSREGVRIERLKVTAGGKYLFLWLTIAANVQPGNVVIGINTLGGRTSINFPIERRGSPQGKFQGFNRDDVIYLIMPDRFADADPRNDQLADSPGTYDRANPRAYHGGDLQGIRDHLDYLRNLGVTTIWLTPIVQNDKLSPQDYHGYGAVDEYAVEEHLGTLTDLQSLVAAAHRKDLKVILDFVPNHVGPRHPWVDSPPEPDWFHGTKDHHTVASSDFQFLADPHAPPRYWRNVVNGWFGNVLPDLNQENPEVAQYFVENALWWAEETGIDGYRLDTFPYVSRTFWSQWHQALKQVFPRMTTVGEVFNRDPVVTSFFAGGRAQYDGIDSGVTTLFDYPLYFALRGVVLDGDPVQKLVDVLADDRLYPHPELLVPFVGNHDVRRIASAKGSSVEKVKLAFSILLTMRGIPELYYGDELGMTGGKDPDNRHDFPGGFPGDKQDAFLASGRTLEQQEIFSHVQKLLQLRREHPALRRGRLWNIEWDASSYAFARVAPAERLLIIFNSSDALRTLHLSFSGTPLEGASSISALLAGRGQQIRKNRIDVTVAAHELRIYSVK